MVDGPKFRRRSNTQGSIQKTELHKQASLGSGEIHLYAAVPWVGTRLRSACRSRTVRMALRCLEREHGPRFMTGSKRSTPELRGEAETKLAGNLWNQNSILALGHA